MTKKGETILSISAFIIMWIIAVIVCLNIPTHPFENKDKYEVIELSVSGGESAWDIYKETCPNSNWNEWCSYVKKINNISSLEIIHPGDVLSVPMPIE